MYVIGWAVVESSCCGAGSWIYTVVPRYIINWQNTKNEAGMPVSEVEPILDEEARKDITEIIQFNEGASPIEF